jgi:hypothetical protein
MSPLAPVLVVLTLPPMDYFWHVPEPGRRTIVATHKDHAGIEDFPGSLEMARALEAMQIVPKDRVEYFRHYEKDFKPVGYWCHIRSIRPIEGGWEASIIVQFKAEGRLDFGTPGFSPADVFLEHWRLRDGKLEYLRGHPAPRRSIRSPFHSETPR